METYLRRTYQQRLIKPGLVVDDYDGNVYPFWDYRSRRGSLSTSSSSGSASFDGCSLSSMSSIRAADNVSVSSSTLSSDSDSVMVTSDPQRIHLQFLVDHHQILPLTNLYQSVVNWIDADLRVFSVTQNSVDETCNQSLCEPKRVSRMPSVALMLFLSEDGPQGYERIQDSKRQFNNSPWKFHHSEHVSHGKINPYPFNSPDYFYTSEELPLWAVRLVHCGKESLRIVLFTSDECWEDMINFYKLVLGSDPDVSRDDFLMFIVHSQGHYDVQFALKKLKGETQPRPLNSVKLKFRVAEVGSLVPLFPNVCKPVSDGLWETRDHDGNVICIEITGNSHPTSSTPEDVQKDVTSRVNSRSSHSKLSNRFRRASVNSSNSVQSLTSVTSPSSTSSLTSSFTSVFSERTDNSTNSRSTQNSDDDKPPAIPPRVPLNVKLRPPRVPEKPKLSIESLRGFYV